MRTDGSASSLSGTLAAGLEQHLKKRRPLSKLQSNHIQCSVCKKPVDSIETWRDFNRQQTIFTVRCHGEKEEIAIDDKDLVDWGGNVKIEAGFAFATKKAEAVRASLIYFKLLFPEEGRVVPDWAQIAIDEGIILRDEGPEFALKIKTLVGMRYAHHDDMIIRGVKGEIYPCKPDIFAMTYEPVEEN